jgi:hypothetical protein
MEIVSAKGCDAVAEFKSGIILCCKLLKTQGKFYGWEAGIRNRSRGAKRVAALPENVPSSRRLS